MKQLTYLSPLMKKIVMMTVTAVMGIVVVIMIKVIKATVGLPYNKATKSLSLKMMRVNLMKSTTSVNLRDLNHYKR
jgi:hypothetical protein